MNARDLDQALEALASEARRLAPAPAALSSLESLCGTRLLGVLTGAVGAGKSSLVEGLTSTTQPTGLGGITTEPVAVEGARWTWVDTPGIDDPQGARRALDPEMTEADVVLWVVDGLQPATERERMLLKRWARGRELRVFVARADLLEGANRVDVESRMREIGMGMEATCVLFGDARAPAPEQLDLLRQHPARPSARRHGLARTALESLVEELGRRAAASPHTAAEVIRAQWRSQVQRVQQVSRRNLEPAKLLARVRDAALDGIRDLDREIRHPDRPWHSDTMTSPHIPAPTLPEPPSAFDNFLRGRPGFERDLERALSDWFLHGTLLLDEWLGGGRALADHRDEHACQALLPSARETLDALTQGRTGP